MTTTYLIHNGRSKGIAHNKFWVITQENNLATVHYGRLGTKGQVKTHQFDTEQKAVSFTNTKIREKLNKGYAVTDQKNLTTEHVRSTIVGTKRKVENICWVEVIEKNDNKIHVKEIEDNQLSDPTIDPAVYVGIDNEEFYLITQTDAYKMKSSRLIDDGRFEIIPDDSEFKQTITELVGTMF